MFVLIEKSFILRGREERESLPNEFQIREFTREEFS